MSFNSFLDFGKNAVDFFIIDWLKAHCECLFVLENWVDKFLVLGQEWIFDFLEFFDIVIESFVFSQNDALDIFLQLQNLIFEFKHSLLSFVWGFGAIKAKKSTHSFLINSEVFLDSIDHTESLGKLLLKYGSFSLVTEIIEKLLFLLNGLDLDRNFTVFWIWWGNYNFEC